MAENEKKARKEFFNWFVTSICPAEKYDDNNVDHNTIIKIEKKMDELIIKYNLSGVSVFESVLYDLPKGYN